MLATLSWTAVTEVHVGPLTLRPHGVLIAVGFLGGALLMRARTRRLGISDEQLWRVLGWGLLGALAGMRAAWVAGHWRELGSPWEIFAIWHGGMSLFGGLAGAVAAGLLAVRTERLPALPMLDSAAPGLAFGIAVGRVSDLIIGDHLGKPSGLPWGFRYAGADHSLAGVPPVGAVVHPVALYDLVLTTVMLVVLIRFLRAPRTPGSAIALFTLWYAGSRMLTDFLRTDPPRLLGLTGSQLASAVLIAGVLGALARRRSGHRLADADESSLDGGSPVESAARG